MTSHTTTTAQSAPRPGLMDVGREILLTTGAILGTICIILTLASLIWGVKPLVFRSGSMSPTIATGALAFAKPVPASELDVGDVVSLETADDGRVTHRITQIDVAGDSFALTLRGDANNIDDAESYAVDSADRVLFAIPKAGYVVSWLSGPAGTFAGGLIVGLVLILILRRPKSVPLEAKNEVGPPC